MLEVVIKDAEIFFDNTNEITTIHGAILKLEHSLVSIQKWESKWHKPFLNKKEDKTFDEIIDYIRCMTLNEEEIKDPAVYTIIPKDTIELILEYLKNPMTATKFFDRKNNSAHIGRSKTITAEVIYYWMITLNIPIEFQHWHINRLMTLIRLINEETGPKNKMSKREILERNKALNEERLKKLKTRG